MDETSFIVPSGVKNKVKVGNSHLLLCSLQCHVQKVCLAKMQKAYLQ